MWRLYGLRRPSDNGGEGGGGAGAEKEKATGLSRETGQKKGKRMYRRARGYGEMYYGYLARGDG